MKKPFRLIWTTCAYYETVIPQYTPIFCDMLPTQLHCLQSLFLCFEAALSLKVNLAKTKLVPVGNVTQVGRLARILGLPLGASYKAKHI
jgi:hypothetical protein